MEGKTHRMLAPAFTVGVSLFYMKAMGIDPPITDVGVCAIATFSSIFSANWADADLHVQSHKPIPVIWAGKNKGINRLLGVKRVQGSSGSSYLYRNKRYSGVKRVDMKIWATIFTILHAKKHRCFTSHSPLLWVPIWYFLTVIAAAISPFGFLYGVVLGFAMGYWSHLLGDQFTKDGLRWLPNIKTIVKIPIIGDIYGALTHFSIFKGKFFTAGNKAWNFIVLLLFADGSLFLLAPDLAKSINYSIFNAVKDFIVVFLKWGYELVTTAGSKLLGWIFGG